VQEKYETTLLDSRLVLFDNTKQSQAEDRVAVDDPQRQLQNDTSKESMTYDDPLRSAELSVNNHHKNADGAKVNSNRFTETEKLATYRNGNDFAMTNPTLLNSAQVLRYTNVDECPDLEDKIQEFLASLFWVLESKRLDRSYEKMDHLTLLTAPFELRKEASVGDSESRFLRMAVHLLIF